LGIGTQQDDPMLRASCTRRFAEPERPTECHVYQLLPEQLI